MGKQLGQHIKKISNEKYLSVGQKQVVKVNMYNKNLAECELIMQHVVLYVPNIKKEKFDLKFNGLVINCKLLNKDLAKPFCA